MAERNDEAPAEEKDILETAPNVDEAESLSRGDARDVDTCIKENQMPSQQQEVYPNKTLCVLFKLKMV